MIRGTLVFAWAVLMSFVGGCANQFLLIPTTEPLTVTGATRRTVAFGASKVLDVWTTRSAAVMSEPQAYVLRFCGNGERAEYALEIEREEWRRLPVEIWAVNYPGFGHSTGPASLTAIPPAALAAFDELVGHAHGKPIFVSGFSMGTTAALYLAARHPIAGMLLHNPPPLRQLILGRYGWWNLWILAGAIAAQVPSDLDNLKNARLVTVPAVFVLSGGDETVPPSYQRKVVDAYVGPKQVVTADGANHNTPLTPAIEFALQVQLEWLWSAAFPETQPVHR
jgi:pimeloyl-ACP methyl ester carboxylesterase